MLVCLYILRLNIFFHCQKREIVAHEFLELSTNINTRRTKRDREESCWGKRGKMTERQTQETDEKGQAGEK
jgi:hypothetical protein